MTENGEFVLRGFLEDAIWRSYSNDEKTRFYKIVGRHAMKLGWTTEENELEFINGMEDIDCRKFCEGIE